MMRQKMLVLFLCSTILYSLTAQANVIQSTPTTADRAIAYEEFRRGVQSFYRGHYNEAVFLFEKSLSYIPGEPLILDWLGKAYYQSGLEGTAIKQWKEAQAEGYGGLLLKNKIELLRERTNIELPKEVRFVESIAFTALTAEQELFRQPISLTAIEDGGFWLTAYGTNELLRFNANGLITQRTKGPIQGFDRPFDIIRLKDGKLAVSEFASDQISVLSPQGKFLTSFGSTGRGNGNVVGPQFLAADIYDNIFVTDFGNARVAVFSSEGEPLFSFGEQSKSFSGFIAPAGISIIDGLVYVADAVKGTIFTFDTAGNYLYPLLPENSLDRIESVRTWQDNLLVCTKNSAVLVDIASATIYSVAKLGNAPIRLTAVVPDTNGNLLGVDYKNEKIYVLAPVRELAAGLSVSIERIYSDQFPQVTLDIRVANRSGSQLVGLDHHNFFLTEENRPVSEPVLIGAGHLNENFDVSIILPRSPQSDKEAKTIHTAIAEIAALMNGASKIHVVSAADTPVAEGEFTPADLSARSVILQAPITKNWKLDLALRLAASNLTTAQPKRAVIYFSYDTLPEDSFERYNLHDLAAYMKNNGILFYAISLNREPLPNEIQYLCKQTGGNSHYVFAEQGLKPLTDHIQQSPNGSYRLQYTSMLPTDFGQAYLPVEVEIRYLTRSGRDETGYFAPLE